MWTCTYLRLCFKNSFTNIYILGGFKFHFKGHTSIFNNTSRSLHSQLSFKLCKSMCVENVTINQKMTFVSFPYTSGSTLLKYKTNDSANKRTFSDNSVIESILKTQAGWFKSLSESSSVGFAKDLVINIHETSGLPWWASIMLTTVLLRTIITLPFALYQNYILAKVENITLEMPELAKELKKETFYAIKKFNWTEKQAAAAYNRTIKRLWNELIVRDNCHPFKGSLLILVQIPMWVIFSTTIRNLVYMLPDRDMASEIISLELSVGGALWFPNLTIPDASLILPVTMGLVNLAIVEVQTLSRLKKPTKLQRYATNLFRGLSVAMIPIAAGVPSCLCLYWTTSSIYGLGQNLLLLSPKVKKLVGIPDSPSQSDKPYQHLLSEIKMDQSNPRIYRILTSIRGFGVLLDSMVESFTT
uniref:Membrane insertase YidC/Oxa/ALB C-terminal domain-containing protein n=1 Tax=Timema cristinae TaxID=61476 RepID=A0A7R9CGI5_TIMCR|nr:unnamed protein product [Timema cristinae]